MATNSNSGTGLGLFGVLLIVFVTLKLIGLIDWPWIWVLSPLWIGLSITLLMIAGLFLFFLLRKGK